MGLEFDFSNLISKLENIEKKASKEISEKALKAGGEEVIKEVKNKYRYYNTFIIGSFYIYGDVLKHLQHY
uniref:HK97 gp10 family phage protein n=1 Tax=Romboutsia ilealis TaxID=1115758 RepID=UPI00257223C3